MLRLTVALGLVALTLAADLGLEREWAEYKVKFGKAYNKVEEVTRRATWEKHRAYIAEHNDAYSKGIYSFWLGPNEYMDVENEDFVRMMNGYTPRADHGSHLVYTANKPVSDLPASVDWRTKGYVTPVKNQGQCGSCWAFSTTGSLEGQHFKATGKLVSLSEQNLVDCSRKQGNQGCQGGLMDNAFKYIKENNGIDTEDSYPYKGTNGQCEFKASNVGANLTSWTDVKHKDEVALQQAVADNGPVSVAIDANHMTFQLYSGGVYHNWFCSENALDHGVLAVGYGTDNGKDYWLVKNSWGPSWGDKGYIMMSRGRHNNCGVASQASFPVV